MPIVKRDRKVAQDPRQRSPWVRGEKKRRKTAKRNKRLAERNEKHSTGWYGTTGMRHAGLDVLAIRKRRAKNRMARKTRAAQRRAAKK